MFSSPLFQKQSQGWVCYGGNSAVGPHGSNLQFRSPLCTKRQKKFTSVAPNYHQTRSQSCEQGFPGPQASTTLPLHSLTPLEYQNMLFVRRVQAHLSFTTCSLCRSGWVTQPRSPLVNWNSQELHKRSGHSTQQVLGHQYTSGPQASLLNCLLDSQLPSFAQRKTQVWDSSVLIGCQGQHPVPFYGIYKQQYEEDWA